MRQMPIWSLTKERVEKLLKQIGDKEIDIDTLIKLTKEDLWKRDLDDFINEWRYQLDDEAKREKKVANMGRRASRKLKIGDGVASRKRKAQGDDSDDSDFGGVAPAKAKKAAVPKPAKEKGGMLSYMVQPTKKKASPKPKGPSAGVKAAQKALDWIAEPTKKEADDVWMNLDGEESDAPKVTKAKASAPAKAAPVKKKKKVISDDDDDEEEEIIRPTASRQPRAAAAKPVKYNNLSDSDGDEYLFDVGKMVKGIDTTSAPADNSRPLFSASMSRPGSSAGLPKKSTSSQQAIDLNVDDTDYSKLAPPTTKKGPAVTARKTILSDDDEDSFDEIIAPAPKASKAKVAAPKAVPKPRAPAIAKKTAKAASQPPEPKKMPLSPAAKAYAAKKAKQQKLAAEAENVDSEDEVEKVANEIMDDDDEDEAPAARRPARRAAVAPKKKWVISESEDEDEDEDEEPTADFDDQDSDD